MSSSYSSRNLSIGFIIIALSLGGILYYNYLGSQDIDMERADSVADNYLESLNIPDLAIGEIMEFENNFYVIYYEKSTGIGAFEMLIDKESARIFPEYGPNMMWNLKYGHGGMMGYGGMMGQGGMMGGYLPEGFDSEIKSEEDALVIAQRFLDQVYPGSEADDPHPFFGYYTIHTTKEGEIFGMLSVNSLTGAVWYHNWHGAYIQGIETH